MKYKVIAFIFSAIVVLLIGYAIGSSLGKSGKSFQPTNEEQFQQNSTEKEKMAKTGGMGKEPSPFLDRSSKDWKPINEDLGFMLFTDRSGIRRATLYVRENSVWKPIAVQSFSEFEPKILPLGQ